MSGQFDYFVMFAEMRTGSNFLEANLNAFPGLVCYGEAFNPNFVGYPNKPDLLGVTHAMREADPLRLIGEMKKQTEGLPGFRFFSGHDPRIPGACLADPRCAKIILTRNPVDSYVSLKIARATDQWKLTNPEHRRTAQITFDKAEFEAHLHKLQTFQMQLLHGLQTSGQTAFHLGYEDIADIDVLNGLAAFLGEGSQLDAVSTALKRQNPGTLRDKVLNHDEMTTALADIDYFALSRTPNFEPRRGPVVPSYVAAAKAPLLYLPVRGGPEVQMRAWLAALDSVQEDALLTGFTQKTLRQWKRRNSGHRSFTVIRHPVARAHAGFCDFILKTGPGTYGEIRQTLRTDHGLPLPDDAGDARYDQDQHRAAFLAFVRFLKTNLGGQTSIRIDPVWASQSQVLQGFSQFSQPDMVLREDQLPDGLAYLAAQTGLTAPALPALPDDHPISLRAIYDKEIEAAVRDAYQRDYMMFGFDAWD